MPEESVPTRDVIEEIIPETLRITAESLHNKLICSISGKNIEKMPFVATKGRQYK